jgi:DNA-binding NtrC family response regulator
MTGVESSTAGGNNEEPYYCDLPYHESMDEHSRYIILRALKEAKGSQTKAAERLKLQRTYLARLMKQRNIPTEPPPS